jgi:PEGA domain
MRIPRPLQLSALLGIFLMPAGDLPAAEKEGAADNVPRKTAIFVQNQEPKLNSKVPFLEDLVASRLGGKDFTVISRADVLNAVKAYSVEKPTASDRNALGTKLDQLLSDNSSALRLAQNMGADFILFVSIGSLEKSTRKFKDDSIGVQTENTIHTLRTTYKVVEGYTGGALGGDVLKSAKTIRQTANLQIDDGDVVNELLEDAAAKVVEGLAGRAAQFKAPAAPGKVEISLAAAVKDLSGNEITLPDVRLNENNQLVQGDKSLPVQASATIEIDGFAMGTTPARIKVFPGAHKLRLTRPGFADVELTINATEGLALTPTLQLNEEGYRRWKDIREFMDKLDTNRKLTDARVEEIRGNAQRLRQSGFLVDYRVNTKEAPAMHFWRSIYGLY